MLFLIKTEIVQMPDMDQDTFQGMVREQWDYILKMKKSGKFKAAYRMSGKKGGIAIADVESHGDLNKILSMLYPWLDTEAVPLIPMEEKLSRVP
jgi:muconolactone delta-isomerase